MIRFGNNVDPTGLTQVPEHDMCQYGGPKHEEKQRRDELRQLWPEYGLGIEPALSLEDRKQIAENHNKVVAYLERHPEKTRDFISGDLFYSRVLYLAKEEFQSS